MARATTTAPSAPWATFDHGRNDSPYDDEHHSRARDSDQLGRDSDDHRRDVLAYDVNDPGTAERPCSYARSAGMTNVNRRPHGDRARRSLPVVPPSVALAKNVAAYRAVRRITQTELAARMTVLGHTMGRSAVSAIEVKSRNVTVDELFGLAISIGVTIGQLLDPTGPDHSRPLAFDVGLKTDDGEARPIAPGLARLWAASRVVARLSADGDRSVEFEPADELPAPAEQELDTRRLNEGNQTPTTFRVTD